MEESLRAYAPKLTMEPSSGQPSSIFDWIASAATVAVFATSQLEAWWSWPGVRWVGVACLAASVPLFSLPFLHLSRFGASEAGKSFIYTTRVADRGVYALVRHPQYLGYGLLVTGFVLLSLNPASVILGSAALVGFGVQARIEERFLTTRMGEAYAEYRRRVPAFNLVNGLWRWWRRRRDATA